MINNNLYYTLDLQNLFILLLLKLYFIIITKIEYVWINNLK